MTMITLETTHQKVVELMSEMIQRGDLQRGEKLNEMKLCDMLGVSRTPIREALRSLHTMGLIDLVPHKGAFVSQFSADETKDMFEVMSTLEGMCARLATQKMSNADFEKIEVLHKNLEKYYRTKDHKEYLETNQEYHSFVQKIAGNKALNEVVNGIRQKILLCRHKQLYLPKRFDCSIKEHRNILEAFRQRDEKKAEKLMSKHLLAQAKALVAQYNEDNKR